MKRMSKLICSLGLTVTALLGTVFSGCAQTGDYTEEIREYQAKLESLAAENEALREQLDEALAGALPETQETMETEESVLAQIQETQTESGTEIDELQQETETPSTLEETKPAEEEDLKRILVLGDSIWGNFRDDTGVAAKVEQYMGWKGYNTKVYNGAIGGTRATIDFDDSPYTFGPASDCSLAKMISILEGNTDVALLEGKAAYEDIKQVMEIKQKIDVVILAYGMNDFLCQAPINNSDAPWTGFGTALVNGVAGVRRIFPQAQIMIIAPSFASYFSIPVMNMGEKALYNYASVACDVAKGESLLCMDAYNKLGIDMYNADEYLEDGVHLNEKGRDLYARGVVAVLLYGQPGQVSGNAITFE